MAHYSNDETKMLNYIGGNDKDKRCHWCHKKNDGSFKLYGKNRDNSLVYVCSNCFKKHSNELHSWTQKVKIKRG